MKTIEEKAKAYDETIKRAKEWEGNPAAIDYIFPELSEFRNEKVRKALIDFFGKSANYGGQTNGVYDKDILAWLEKQGGYANFRDKAQVGDRITKNEDGVLVNLSQLKRVAKPSKKQGEKKELKKIEPKPEENNGNLGGISSNWSEEDEENMKKILDAIGSYYYLTTDDDVLCTWLKSLKGRVGCEANCTTTKEWSEEDSFRTETLISVIKSGGSIRPELRNEFVNWLKSLRPQNTWKPSDEQVKAFEHFVRSIGESGYASPYENNTKLLYSLLEQLKKLL